MNKTRCFVCLYQRRPSDLLEDYQRTCLFCQRNFCYPHHSANPCEIPGVKTSLYAFQYTDFSNGVHNVKVHASLLCIVCGLQAPRGHVKANDWIRIKELSLIQNCNVYEE